MNKPIDEQTITHHHRPTLVIGLGGTGHRIVVNLKAQVHHSWSSTEIEQQVRFLVFDTASEQITANGPNGVISLDLGAELFDIGQTPVANIKRHLAQQVAIEARLGSIMAGLPPTFLRSGAKQLRPLGLLAFLWRYVEIETQIRDALWTLAGRQQEQGREGLNVFIVNSLVGGTGSSTFLDVAHLVRDLVDELGTMADFCYITGIGVLPRAFHGINGPNLIPNAVASLIELNHCMMEGGFNARYPNGRVISTVQPPFNMYYLVDGVDERGHTWHGPAEVCRLAAAALFLQMGSQVGQKHENDFDNLDDVLVRRTAEGHGTFFGSFGLAALMFPANQVAHRCAVRLAAHVIDHGLLNPPPPPDTVQAWITQFCEAAGLDLERLAERLAQDEQGLPLAVELTVPGWVNRLAPTAIPGELIRYVRDYEYARLNTDYKRALKQNETDLSRQALERLEQQSADLARRHGLPAVGRWLAQLQQTLEKTIHHLTSALAETESRQTALTQEVSHLELAFMQAAESGFLGRGQRIARSQHAYLTAVQPLFEIKWQLQIALSQLRLFNQLLGQVQHQAGGGQDVTVRLQAARRALAGQLTGDDQRLREYGASTRSLATPELINYLYEGHAGPPADILAALFTAAESPLDWQGLAPAAIGDRLLAACRPAFAPIAATGVEQIIELQRAQNAPENFYAWLMGQATPSWNLDRTRMADGGATLQRLEVLGVPDEDHSIFRRYARMLVSTSDPDRITAFVAHVGAPHSAIQQWDSYQTEYHHVRGQTPLHILPQFQADSRRAEQSFALGSLFGFITNQGAFFYYHPADALERPVKLGQGLANSLQAFTHNSSLVQETRDRVDQMVAGRGVEASLHTLARYYEHSNGQPPGDELVLKLKRLVRDFAAELRQIRQFAPGQLWTGNGDPDLPVPESESNDDGR